MAVVAGIDEAGLGPILGPLVVTATAFEVPDHAIDDCLWKTLKDRCSRNQDRSGRRLWVTDSKRIYQSGKNLGLLERAALVMLATADVRPATMAALFERLAPDAAEQLAAHPWYVGLDRSLPLTDDAGDIGTRANALRLAMAACDVRLRLVRCAVLCEWHYNQQACLTRNKSVVVQTLVLKHVDRLISLFPQERIRVHVDRLGGRRHYREALQLAFPEFSMQVLEELEENSAYRMTRGRQTVDISFSIDGDQKHLSTSLASIYSKYLRELCMYLFNHYWAQHLPDLKPTAGYYGDAQRWLTDADPIIRRMGIPRDRLVRSR